jgi:hypothetical protein
MSDYPGALDDLSEQNTPDRSRPRYEAQQSVLIPQAIEAVQAELGVTPSAAYDDVAARLAAIEEAVVAPPAEPDEITGDRSTDVIPIMALLLTALDDLGLITDSTTAGE